MAFCEFKNVRIAGVAAGVPKNIISNLTLSSGDGSISSDYSPEAFVELTGVKERHVSDHLTTSDLGFAAAERLISDLKWNKADIEAVIFVSQTADYLLPCTSCILQDRLGLSKECYAADVSLGCSGWVYGLSYVCGLLSTGAIRKAILIAGDAKKHSIDARVQYNKGELLLRFRDDCKPFNPQESAKLFDPDDIAHNIGIRMVSKIAKKMNYQNMLGMNVLTIRL